MTDPIRAGNKDPFVYQKPIASDIVKIEKVRQACRDLCALLMTEILPSRERSLALTKLEEVSMWANKAIVFEVKEQG